MSYHETPLAGTGGANGRESADDYAGVLATLAPRWRVILCRQRTQWILQRRDAGRAHAAAWRGVRYHRSRTALIASCVALCGLSDADAGAMLAHLPETFARSTYDGA